jgi:hypothetical protein
MLRSGPPIPRSRRETTAANGVDGDTGRVRAVLNRQAQLELQRTLPNARPSRRRKQILLSPARARSRSDRCARHATASVPASPLARPRSSTPSSSRDAYGSACSEVRVCRRC